MRYDNVYFINGTAYAGKSTMVHHLAEKHGGIELEENYHGRLKDVVNEKDFPALSYTKYLKDWADFIRRTPDEYEDWIDRCSKECETLELRILDDIAPSTDKKIFVDTNICIDTLRAISDREHVLIMLADPGISVSRFFDRPDSEKQFLYRLLLAEPDPQAAIANFRECLSRINSPERYDRFLNSGFNVIKRDDSRTVEETALLAERFFALA